ncbi:hypothetical protein QJ856_gp0353 [Tupanvirus deep ocean]|uniref:Uncharacterized protein n=2 Tax=Tupanvirus TaxID=2094720 RepID=A0AC62A9K2_9VIRU|nr:hypothetical protein QJ856_gp0353 [Tupanvirus deep ocean]QKU34384.1 hypothetical protein [Tupanvirus deep ocean]
MPYIDRRRGYVPRLPYGGGVYSRAPIATSYGVPARVPVTAPLGVPITAPIGVPVTAPLGVPVTAPLGLPVTTAPTSSYYGIAAVAANPYGNLDGDVIAKYGDYRGLYSRGFPNRVSFPYPYVTDVYYDPYNSYLNTPPYHIPYYPYQPYY